MTEPLTLRGVPHALRMDGWWLGSDDPPPLGQAEADRRSRGIRIGALLAIVVLADLLFWHQRPGLSVALFAIALFAAAVCTQSPRRAAVWPLCLLLLAVAPVVDHVQMLSVAFLAGGLITALVWQRHPGLTVAPLIATAFGFAGRLPGHWIGQLRPANLRGISAAVPTTKTLRDWALPIGGSLLFASLLMDANPVLGQVLLLRVDLWDMLGRIAFWTGTALVMAPLVTVAPPAQAVPDWTGPRRMPGFGINARSVLRALVMFNLLIGMQMLADVSILIGGAALPDGMSFADYAHRGAYPLLFTALLAGAFALASRPFWAEHRLIRPLMAIWLGQNVVLCGAAALRLDLYIGAYGLTYLRIYALIWIALVALGLLVILLQMLLTRDGGWLMCRLAALGVGTLYLCSFVNFASLIATQNLTMPEPDFDYVCALGPMAAAPVRAVPAAAFPPVFATRACPALQTPQIDGWRDWGFRAAQVLHKVQAATNESPRR